MTELIDYINDINPIQINGKEIAIVDSAEHVGINRCSSGNLLTIMTRISAHKRAIGSVYMLVWHVHTVLIHQLLCASRKFMEIQFCSLDLLHLS